MKQLSIYDELPAYHPALETPGKLDISQLSKAECEAHSLHNVNVDADIQSVPEEKAEPVQANVTEIIITKDQADKFQMLLPMLTQLNQEERWLAWVDPPIQLLKQWRSKTDHSLSDDIMIIRSDEKSPALELTKKALRAGTCHAVIVWTEHLSQDQFNALEEASAEGNSHGIVLRYR